LEQVVLDLALASLGRIRYIMQQQTPMTTRGLPLPIFLVIRLCLAAV